MTGEAIFWICALVVLVVAELATMQLVSIWFAAGALVSLILSAVGLPTMVQAVAFLAVSAILLAFTRPLMKKLMHKEPIPTNSELDIGKTALVVESIDSVRMTGRVTLGGVDWTACSTGDVIIPQGETVVVDRIEGAKVFVSVE